MRNYLKILLVVSCLGFSNISNAQENVNKTVLPKIPQQLFFCNEAVPLERLDVRESLDRELLVNTFWHSQTYLLIKRANRYFPVIEPILKEQGVPDDFKYLALIESGFTNIVSPAGAAGFWQFLKTTGEKYGLIVDDEVDERYNLEKATIAACNYLKNSYSLYKNWTLAAAAFNMGDNGMLNQIKTQKVSNYYDLYLNTETARYVYRILAIKIIYENPAASGFTIEKEDLYPRVRTSTITVDSAISDLAQFALDKGITYKMLKEYNPWLRKNSLTNKSKNKFIISIPDTNDLYYKAHFK
ncbi:MAG: Membrane-bound lytic murein transglycosylase D precursor [Bacteroidetes bacterium ADurb.Bin408]|nr:MAG: Membrane-bound lytic murein transglycosylase D precursor [Bacteroidetes bacterium ADurb.Bin408]